MSHFTALFDAGVLYPAPLRDLRMHLELTDLVLLDEALLPCQNLKRGIVCSVKGKTVR